MVAKERRHHPGLVGLEAPRHLVPERSAPRPLRRRQRREGQDRRAGQIARQQEPPRRAVRPAGGAGGLKIAGELCRHGAGTGLVMRGGRVGAVQPGEKGHCLGPAGDPAQHRLRPAGIILPEKAKVEQPFAGIVDDVEMQPARPAQGAEDPGLGQPERQPEFADRPGAVGPVRLGSGQRRQMRLEVEARHRVVGLGLQIGRENPPLGRGAQARHPRPVHQVGHQRGDEDGLAGARQAGDAQPDHRVRQRRRHRLDHPAKPVGNIGQAHVRPPGFAPR